MKDIEWVFICMIAGVIVATLFLLCAREMIRKPKLSLSDEEKLK